MIRRRVVATGAVQGVGFRWSAAREAEQHSVSGWVRNRSDGTVEASLEGEEHAVCAVLAWFREGPPGARVDDLDVREDEPQGISGFVVQD
ncbi:acylphosphatase [Cellulomonas endophytica]|uniref:acylphosphatase n=1 Tax=Cellulomonas endophytica TaxID=2494735 RepID=UPI0010134BFA|nr:acylphosphatase [Cellulomonas endophytica]